MATFLGYGRYRSRQGNGTTGGTCSCSIPYEPADEKEALLERPACPLAARGRLNHHRGDLLGGVCRFAFLKTQGFLRLPLSRPDEYRRLELNLADRLPEYLADRTQQALEGQPKSHIAFVVRTGAIYPFTTISQTLAVCETRKIGATLAVLGPGHVTDRGRSFGLLAGPRASRLPGADRWSDL